MQFNIYSLTDQFVMLLFQVIRRLAVFDFDHTIIDDNSDVAVQDVVDNIPNEVKKVYKEDGWTEYMQAIFDYIFKSGVSISVITKKIDSLKPVDGMVDLIKYLDEEVDYDIVIVSDSNSYFIDSWLESHGLKNNILQVFTNPAEVRDGKLNIEMYHLQTTCQLSSKNLCKGQILTDFCEQQKLKNVIYDKIIYVGDGNNDLCPVLRLSENDVAFARKDYKLHKLLDNRETRKDYDSSQNPVKAKIQAWETGYDVIKYLRQFTIDV